MGKKAVIIGAGFAAKMHVKALKTLGIPVKCVISAHKESAKKFAEEYDIPEYGTAVEAALDESVTHVHICTPPASHAELIKKLITAGKNVLCEKPLCVSEKEVSDILKLIDERKQTGQKTGRLALNYNVRFFAAAGKMREIVRKGSFGKVTLVHGNYMQEFHALPSIYDWRYRPDMAGPMRAVTEIGSHWFDLAQFVSDSAITGVSATFKNGSEYRILNDGIMSSEDANMEEDFGDKKIHVDSEDAAAVTMRFDNGAMGNVMLSEISHGRNNHLFIEVDMLDGSVWWNEEDPNHVYFGKKNKPVSVEINAFGGGFNDSVAELFREFYEEKEKSEMLPSVKDGARIVRVCNAVYESARQHSSWVNVKR
ncbi:Predicted dehydrogenase [Lachnospiraceae bacterium]|nr:Predicted dehydrogenase [Lachnospiraceae bacterium]